MGIVDYLISYTIIILSFVDKKKIPLQLVDKEKDWVIISTIKENNITIGYDYIPWRILQVIMMVKLKII